jgi:hypothetical protein
LQGRVPRAKLVAFDPNARMLSAEEVEEVLYKRTLGGRRVRL